MENIVVLGATGSIGNSTLDVIRHYPDKFRLIGVSGYTNISRIRAIIDEFHPEYVCLKEEDHSLIKEYRKIEFMWGEKGLEALSTIESVDTVIIAVSGIAGLAPTLKAIANGKRVISANKESIVCGGHLINSSIEKYNNPIIPLDSEHNAIYHLMKAIDNSNLESIILTASGGPFLDRPIDSSITIEQVLNHPTWDMGQVITVNSATMMNKGFEVIEAHHLFHLSYQQIQVLIHPQSIVHGIVRTVNGSMIMLASPNDMRYPISLVLLSPNVSPYFFNQFNLIGTTLEFLEPDTNKFPLLKLAYQVGSEGGILPTVLCAINEAAVELFLDGKLHFSQITKIIMKYLSKVENISQPDYEEILGTFKLIKNKVKKET